MNDTIILWAAVAGIFVALITLIDFVDKRLNCFKKIPM
jgi:hypothetical protein